MVASQIFQLPVAFAFDGLDPQQKLMEWLAHHLPAVVTATGSVSRQAYLDFGDVQLLLDYAAMFLSNMGNYYGSGDQKFTPAISKDKLAVLAASASSSAATLWEPD
ncbi:hypothetical protein BDV29DRAFT_155462 [Aspergillus leporis]|uniref:Uncharacterized protein n=1 Tax=Aspergillus leporis TaxID=41062 RepID=A0A5N5X6F7_9EURO|nr:hypothetical protein BDV29DRAFT_155462 [Aspergillus leporis]